MLALITFASTESWSIAMIELLRITQCRMIDVSHNQSQLRF